MECVVSWNRSLYSKRKRKNLVKEIVKKYKMCHGDVIVNSWENLSNSIHKIYEKLISDPSDFFMKNEIWSINCNFPLNAGCFLKIDLDFSKFGIKVQTALFSIGTFPEKKFNIIFIADALDNTLSEQDETCLKVDTNFKMGWSVGVMQSLLQYFPSSAPLRASGL